MTSVPDGEILNLSRKRIYAEPSSSDSSPRKEDAHTQHLSSKQARKSSNAILYRLAYIAGEFGKIVEDTQQINLILRRSQTRQHDLLAKLLERDVAAIRKETNANQ